MRQPFGGPAAVSRAQIIGTAVLFSTGGTAIKAIDMSGIQVAFLRSLIAACVLALAIPAARRGWSWKTLVVALAYAGTLITFVTANKQTTAANAIFLQSTSLLYLLLIGPLLLREPLRRMDLATVTVLMGGVSLFFLDTAPATETAPNPTLGNILALISGAGWALTIGGLRWLGRQSGPGAAGAATLTGNLTAAVVCAAFAFPIVDTGPTDWLWVAYLGIFQIGLAYVLLTRAVSRVTALEASLLLFVEPALSPVWAWLVHGETPGRWSLTGGALILLATLVWSVLDARRTPESANAT